MESTTTLANLNEVRIQMLDKILWALIFVSGFAALVAMVEQWQSGNIILVLIYGAAYASLLWVSLHKSYGYRLRATIPLMIVFAIVLSELIYFGVSRLSYVLMYTLVIFAGILFSFRAAVASVVLVILSISITFWLGEYSTSINQQAALWQWERVLGAWLSPMVAFLCCVAIATIAITTMLQQLASSLADKSELVEDLTREVDTKHRAQQALKLSEDQFAALFERSNDAVFLIKIDSGKHVQTNSAARRMTGLAQRALQACTIQSLLSHHGPEILSHLQAGETVSELEVEYPHGDGGVRHAVLQATPLSSELGFVIVHDITERRQLEKQFIHSQKMEAIGQLAGGVAHDFNNSLQAMIGYGELAVMKSEDPVVHAYLKKILKGGKRAQKLIAQLLAFSRRQVLEVEPLDLAAAVDESLQMVRRVIGEHIQLKFNSPTSPLIVNADRTQLEQVLMNLCINARDAMGDSGELRIALTPREFKRKPRLSSPWAEKGNFIRLDVEDSGCGMSEETRTKIFEPFFTTKSPGKGTGLGLSTVFGIVRQHKGFIHVTSKLGKGTKVSVYLPQADATAVLERDEVAPPLQTGTETILLADDDDMVRDATCAMLELGGYRVLQACNGDEAIALFDSHREQIDIVVLDVVMPNTGGGAVSAHIEEIAPGMPILFASGYSEAVLHTDFVLDRGVNLIQKPFQQAELLDRVRTLLDTQKECPEALPTA